MSQKSLDQTIRKYYKCAKDPHSRFRSWDHCYGFFRKHRKNLLQVEDAAALRLGFYLASWGMYRGSGFLLQYAYTVHKPIIHALTSSEEFLYLWQYAAGIHNKENKEIMIEKIMGLVETVRRAYDDEFGEKPTDTLVTKILLGTVGCLPARDTYFGDGFKDQGFVYGSLNRGFVKRILQFCSDNQEKLQELQPKILDLDDLPYPLMKLVDMHFWQIGYDLNSS